MSFLVRLVCEVLQFDEEVSRSEGLAETMEGEECIVVSAGVDEVAHLALTAGGETDESLAVGVQRSEGHERRMPALWIGQMSGGDDAAEVGIALPGLGEE